MLHLRPTGRVEQVQASLALYFSNTPPERMPVMLLLTRQDVDLAPGAEHVVVKDEYVVPADVDLFNMQPTPLRQRIRHNRLLDGPIPLLPN